MSNDNLFTHPTAGIPVEPELATTKPAGAEKIAREIADLIGLAFWLVVLIAPALVIAAWKALL